MKMRTRRRLTFALMAGLLPAILLATPQARAQRNDPVGSAAKSVRVSIEVATAEPTGEGSGGTRTASSIRRYQLLATTDGSASRLSTGTRIPVSLGSQNANSEAVATTQYQDIGFSAEVQVFKLGNDLYQVNAILEDSHVPNPQGVSQRPPVVRSHSQRVRGTLALGERILLASESEGGFRVTLAVNESLAEGAPRR